MTTPENVYTIILFWDTLILLWILNNVQEGAQKGDKAT